MRYADSSCTYEEIYFPNHLYRYRGKDLITGDIIEVDIPADELYAYRQGALIQSAMPSLTADEREFLISGISNLDTCLGDPE